MPEYLTSGMRLYLDHLVDWKTLLTLWKGDGVDVGAEVDAYRTVLETTASITSNLEAAARAHWADGAELTSAEKTAARPSIPSAGGSAVVNSTGNACSRLARPGS